VFLGPLIDKYDIPIFNQPKKSWLFVGMIINGIMLFFFTIDIATFLILFAVIFFLQALGFSVMDAAVDSIAVSLKKDHGVLESHVSLVMFLGTFFGGILTFLVAGIFQTHYGVGFIVLAVVSLGLASFIFFYKEGEVQAPKEKRIISSEDFKELFGNKTFQLALLVAFLYNLDGGLLEFTFEPFLGNTFGVTVQQVTGLTVLPALVGSIIAMIVAWRLKDKLNVKIAIIGVSLYYASLMLLIVMFIGSLQMIVVFYVFIITVSGFGNMMMYAYFLSLSKKEIPASSFVFLMGAMNGGMLLGILLGGFMNMTIIYLMATIILCVRIIPMIAIMKREVE